MPNEKRSPSQAERDERITLPLDAETALAALLKVNPDDIAAATDESENDEDEG